MSHTTSVIGASGFVGTQLVESLILDGREDVTAIIRKPKSMARLGRFGPALAVKQADAESPEALAQALRDSKVVVNLCTGPPSAIRQTTKSILDACALAGVERLIHLSSAVVYGGVESPIEQDDAPPLDKLWMPYARAKAWAEIWIKQRIPRLPFEVVVLRPGIVWGVRSPHTLDILDAIRERRAYLVDDGQGVFNGINIENLLRSIRASSELENPLSGFYNVADAEPRTWRDLYSSFAVPLGCDLDHLKRVSGDRPPWSLSLLAGDLQNSPAVNLLYDQLKRRLPDHLKAAIKKRLDARAEAHQALENSDAPPRVDREMWQLQKTRHRLSPDRFHADCPLDDPVPFSTAVRRSLTWFASLNELPLAQQTPRSTEGVLHARP